MELYPNLYRTVFLIGLRIFVKLQRMKALKAGDYWMIAAGVSQFTLSQTH